MCDLRHSPICYVQLNSNLTLAHLSLAETWLIFKFACKLVANTRMCLKKSMADKTCEIH